MKRKKRYSARIAKNNISPQTIKKFRRGFGTLRQKPAPLRKLSNKNKLNKPRGNYLRIKDLKVKMKAFAKAIDFESAAKVRDEIKELKDQEQYELLLWILFLMLDTTEFDYDIIVLEKDFYQVVAKPGLKSKIISFYLRL